MMWYLVMKNRCVCVWFSSAFTTGPVGFRLKKKQRKIGRFFFGMPVSMENGTHIIMPQKNLLNRQMNRFKEVRLSYPYIVPAIRFTQGIDGELSERWKRPDFFSYMAYFEGREI